MTECPVTGVTAEMVDSAFRESEAQIFRRRKKWSERTRREKLFFWRRPTIFDPDYARKMMDLVMRRANVWNELLPPQPWPEPGMFFGKTEELTRYSEGKK